METFLAHLAARDLADDLLIAHHLSREDRAFGANYHMEHAEKAFRQVAERLGYRVEKIEPAAAEQREAA